ncbi:MAG TPA: alkaline phosphatase family protein [Anaerolineales bacterium]|nr:alkaline phosphatase family protein [Anaerolineales bacterium]
MPDLTDQLLPELRSRRIPELALPEDLLVPAYQGQSILNIPNSICRLLDVPPINENPPLRPEILDPLGTGAKKVLFILMDALALHRFKAWTAAAENSVWQRLMPDSTLAPLTSIAPSTTSAALSTYWTGTPAGVHGVVGYEAWLKEYGIVANMIQHKPINYRGGRDGSLDLAGFEPETFLQVPTMGTHLSAHGVAPHAFQSYTIIHSGLSRMYFSDVEKHATSTAVDLWVTVRKVFEQSTADKLYAWVYWPDVDGLSHFFGPDEERVEGEFANFSRAFDEYFLQKLSAGQLKDTVVILGADHGQILTDKTDAHYDLRNHPDFTRRLHMMPTGENRMAFLYIKPGQVEAVREYIERTWPNQFTLLEPAYAVEKGLFGPGKPNPRLLDRIGDMIALARGTAFWWWSSKENPIVGRHGGLHEQEMVVPFFATRF